MHVGLATGFANHSKIPHAECMRSIRLFAKACLREMQSWPSAPVAIDGDIGPRAAE
jgi:hypothetical protein